MSFNGVNYGDISPRVGIHAVAKMLAYAQPILILERFAQPHPLPKNKGLTIKWRRPIPFDVSVNALTEGVTPTSQALRYEDVTAVIQQYGAWVEFTDVIADTHEDPNLQVMSALCGEQAASIKEAIIWNEIKGGTNVIYSGTATARTGVVAPVDEVDLRLAQRQLKANHAKHITKMIGATDKIGTEPVAPGFVAFTHTNMEQDLRALDGFVVREKYASYQPINEHEIGKFEDIRFLISPQLEPFFGAGDTTLTGVLNNGTRVDVYPIVIVAQDAYGVTPLKGMESVAMAVKNPKMGVDSTDPLGQRGYVAWKMWYVATRLNEQWMVRIEAAVSAL